MNSPLPLRSMKPLNQSRGSCGPQYLSLTGDSGHTGSRGIDANHSMSAGARHDAAARSNTATSISLIARTGNTCFLSNVGSLRQMRGRETNRKIAQRGRRVTARCEERSSSPLSPASGRERKSLHFPSTGRRYYRSTMFLRLLLIAFLLAGSTDAARAKTVAEAFDAEMRAWMVAHGAARGSLGVMRDGRLIHVVGFGDRGADTRVGIWSLSKAITATCVTTLARDKLLSLTSPIGPLLSATFQRYGMPVDPRLERATVLNLVSHRSGIPTRVGGNRFAPGTGDLLRTHEPASATAQQLLPEILKIRLTHEPGEQFQYSNIGYLLLGRIIEQVTGKAYDEACYERVLRPSGISGARLHQTWGRLLDAAAGWELSAAEYALPGNYGQIAKASLILRPRRP